MLVRVLSTLGRPGILAVLATLATLATNNHLKRKPVDASCIQASSALSKIVALASQPTKMASETHLCSDQKMTMQNDKKYTQTKSARESTRIQISQVTVVAIGRVSWVNPGNAGSAAILRSRKTGKTCQAGNAMGPRRKAPITSRCTCGSNTTNKRQCRQSDF